MTVVAVTSKSDIEDRYMVTDCVLELVFARLDGSSWFGSVVHLADESSLLVLEVRDGVIVLHAMSFCSSLWLWLYALESSRWMPRASIRPSGRFVLSRWAFWRFFFRVSLSDTVHKVSRISGL